MEQAVSPPEEGTGVAGEPEIDPYVLALPCQRPHTLSDASTLPRDPSPLSFTISPPASPSLLDQEDQDTLERQEDKEQSDVDERRSD